MLGTLLLAAATLALCAPRVAHAQAGMAALLHVGRRPAEAADQEQAQALFGARQVFLWIHRPENVVLRHLSVEGRHQAAESIFANSRIHIAFVHVPII